MRHTRALLARLKLRLRRRALQVRALVRGRDLRCVADRTGQMPDGPVLFSTLRNELVRLPYFIDYYRRLGVVHFCIVDNGSTDGSQAWLRDQDDVSVWQTDASYKRARFGVDWLNWLLARHGRGRWVLVVDPDEFLVFPHCDRRKLPALTRHLEDRGAGALGTLLLDLYGEGPVSETRYRSGEDPVACAPWFDANNYVVARDALYHNLWIQGGPRMRAFFADCPKQAPAVNKIPLVKWQRGYVYNAGAHDLLPRHVNRVYTRSGGSLTSGVLLHAKFLHVLVSKVTEEVDRQQHYADSSEYRAYAEAGGNVCLWTAQSTRYQGWQQLCDLGLMARGGWF